MALYNVELRGTAAWSKAHSFEKECIYPTTAFFCLVRLGAHPQ